MGARRYGGAVGGLTRPSEFVALEDTPSSYSGQSGKSVAVNAGEDGVEFAAAAVSDFINLDDTPADYTGQTGKGVTVNPGETGVEFTVIGAASKAGMFGDGSDGDVTIAVDTDLAGVAKQYNNLTINAGKKLYDSTRILIVRVKNTLTLTGNIDQNGLGAPGGAGGVGLVAGIRGSDGYIHNGGGQAAAVGAGVAANNGNPYGGGASGAGAHDGRASGAGGDGLDISTGGVGTEVMGTDHPDGKFEVMGVTRRYGGCGGGGGGAGRSAGGATVANGGAGGAGGGVATVFAREISGAGNIRANGIDGSNGSINTDCGGGGGGGGAGGFLYVMAMNLGAATFEVNGGSGGTGGADPTNPGGNGAAGRSGLRRIELIS